MSQSSIGIGQHQQTIHTAFSMYDKSPMTGCQNAAAIVYYQYLYICIYRTRNYSPLFSVSQSAHTAERYSRERANALVGSIAQGPIHKWWLYLAFTHVITQRERWIPNYYYCYSSSFSLLFTFIDESIFPYMLLNVVSTIIVQRWI
jgi:hypothetical protein